MAINYPRIKLVRYADDIIVHVKNEVEAKQILKSIRARMHQCRLELHAEKTRLVYCNRKGRRKQNQADVRQFDFLDYTFRSRKVMTKKGDIMFGFSPAISRKSMKYISKECQKLGFHRWTHLDIHQLSAQLSAKI